MLYLNRYDIDLDFLVYRSQTRNTFSYVKRTNFKSRNDRQVQLQKDKTTTTTTTTVHLKTTCFLLFRHDFVIATSVHRISTETTHRTTSGPGHTVSVSHASGSSLSLLTTLSLSVPYDLIEICAPQVYNSPCRVSLQWLTKMRLEKHIDQLTG